MYTLFSTPRTGSILASGLLWLYLRNKYKYNSYIIEMFNQNHYNVWHDDNIKDGILLSRHNHSIKVKNSYKLKFKLSHGTIIQYKDYDDIRYLDESEIIEEDLYRLDILKQASKNNDYFLNNHATPLGENVFKYLTTLDVICIERKDKFEQIMSNCIAHHTKQYWCKDNSSIIIHEKDSIQVDEKFFKNTLKRYETYTHRKKMLIDPITIYYEDINDMKSYLEFGELVGFKDYDKYVTIDEIDDIVGVKQNPDDKLKYFKNKNQMISWFEEWNEHITVT